MKGIISALLVCVLLVGVVFALASCGKTLSGKYEAEANLGITTVNYTYEFKGSKVTATVKSTNFLGQVESVTVEGTYEIEDDEITFAWDSEEEVLDGGTFTFEETEDGIKIGKFEFKKAEK